MTNFDKIKSYIEEWEPVNSNIELLDCFYDDTSQNITLEMYYENPKIQTLIDKYGTSFEMFSNQLDVDCNLDELIHVNLKTYNELKDDRLWNRLISIKDSVYDEEDILECVEILAKTFDISVSHLRNLNVDQLQDVCDSQSELLLQEEDLELKHEFTQFRSGLLKLMNHE